MTCSAPNTAWRQQLRDALRQDERVQEYSSAGRSGELTVWALELWVQDVALNRVFPQQAKKCWPQRQLLPAEAMACELRGRQMQGAG